MLVVNDPTPASGTPLTVYDARQVGSTYALVAIANQASVNCVLTRNSTVGQLVNQDDDTQWLGIILAGVYYDVLQALILLIGTTTLTLDQIFAFITELPRCVSVPTPPLAPTGGSTRLFYVSEFTQNAPADTVIASTDLPPNAFEGGVTLFRANATLRINSAPAGGGGSGLGLRINGVTIPLAAAGLGPDTAYGRIFMLNIRVVSGPPALILQPQTLWAFQNSGGNPTPPAPTINFCEYADTGALTYAIPDGPSFTVELILLGTGDPNITVSALDVSIYREA